MTTPKHRNRPRKILVATDFSAGSRAALRAAEKLSANGGRLEMHLVHVLEPLHFAVPPAPVWVDYDAGRRRDATRMLEEIAARVRRDLGDHVRVKAHILLGAAHAAICRLGAKLAPDVIVVGTHGRTGLKHALIGSVAERVVRHAKRPVLTVPMGSRASA